MSPCRMRNTLRRVSTTRLSILGLALFVAVVANASASVSASASTDRVGTYPAWLSAGLTGFAFLITACIFLRDSKDRVREQAHQIYAWEERVVDNGVLRVTTTVFNPSEHPVWSVSVQPRAFGKPLAGVNVKRHGRSAIKPAHEEQWSWELTDDDSTGLEPQPLLTFTDAANRRWSKWGSSDLHRQRRGR